MNHFTTTGEVRTVRREDGSVKGYYVGRENADPIFVSVRIPEYEQPGKTLHIDRWGRAWLKVS